MGVYDTIICERIMPDGWDATGKFFQTKDLDCTLDKYTITKDNRMVTDTYYLEMTPDDELPYPDQPYIGCVRRKDIAKDVDTHYHGIFEFYTSDDQHNWHQYKAKFTDGLMVELTVVEQEKSSYRSSRPQSETQIRQALEADPPDTDTKS